MHWLEKLKKIDPSAANQVEIRGYNKSARSLKQAFAWDSTPEGHEYWRDLHEEIENFKEEVHVNTRHKHADLIHAWADGAEIEWKNYNECWIRDSNPEWRDDFEYRIKPKTHIQKVSLGIFTSRGKEYVSAVPEDQIGISEQCENFVRWATDVINVELEGE